MMSETNSCLGEAIDYDAKSNRKYAVSGEMRGLTTFSRISLNKVTTFLESSFRMFGEVISTLSNFSNSSMFSVCGLQNLYIANKTIVKLSACIGWSLLTNWSADSVRMRMNLSKEGSYFVNASLCATVKIIEKSRQFICSELRKRALVVHLRKPSGSSVRDVTKPYTINEKLWRSISASISWNLLLTACQNKADSLICWADTVLLIIARFLGSIVAICLLVNSLITTLQMFLSFCTSLVSITLWQDKYRRNIKMSRALRSLMVCTNLSFNSWSKFGFNFTSFGNCVSAHATLGADT